MTDLNTQMTPEAMMQAEIEKLTAENAALCLNCGSNDEDVWVDYQEVDQADLEALADALSLIEKKPEGKGDK